MTNDSFYALHTKSERQSKAIIGGKAYNLKKMIDMQMPVPLAFVGATFNTFYVADKTELPIVIRQEINSHIRYLALRTETQWNPKDGTPPLIVSVRSGSAVSMPGMMDTILNVGLNRDNLEHFGQTHGNRKFALDSYRRLIQMYAVTVKNVDPTIFSEINNAVHVYHLDGLSESNHEDLVALHEKLYEQHVGEPFSANSMEHLEEAILAVYRSWFSQRAINYRAVENIPEDLGTAVIVQQMVFGNKENSATGVAFSHNPNSGTLGLYGDYLESAQGEDVVSGTHLVQPIEHMFSTFYSQTRELQSHIGKLLALEKDIVDVEFTIEDNHLWLLQYRVAKRSQRASIHSLFGFVKSGILSVNEATQKMSHLLPPPPQTTNVTDTDLAYLGTGVGVTDGIALGQIATTHEQAQNFADQKIDFIYVAHETSPEDTLPMKWATGILTALGGKLSHAAIIARGWEKPCVVGFENMIVNDQGLHYKDTFIDINQIIKIDGATGEIWA